MGVSAVLRISIASGRPVYKWPHFHADWGGMEAWGTNRQTLVSLAAAKSPPWCIQHALSVAVISCDIAVSARYTFTQNTLTHTHTHLQEPQGCPSCFCFCLHTPWSFPTSPLSLPAACCAYVAAWFLNGVEIVATCGVDCVWGMCACVCVCVCVCACLSGRLFGYEKRVFLPFNLWSSAFFRRQLYYEIINNSNKNKSNSSYCWCNNGCSSKPDLIVPKLAIGLTRLLALKS